MTLFVRGLDTGTIFIRSEGKFVVVDGKKFFLGKEGKVFHPRDVMVGKGIEPIPNPFRVVETPKIEVSKEMVDRAIAIQCLRSDRKLTPTDRTWIEASLKVALDSEYDPFPNAPGLFDEIVSEL